MKFRQKCIYIYLYICLKKRDMTYQDRKMKFVTLRKAICVLKQATRAWTITTEETINKLGFMQITADPCLCTIKIKKTTFIIIYVEEILISESTK